MTDKIPDLPLASVLRAQACIDRSGDDHRVETLKDYLLMGAERLEVLEAKIENAGQAMAETQRSWEHRCHAIIAALELDFGGPTPDIPEQDSWHARKMKLADDKILQLLAKDLEQKERIEALERELAEANADADRLRKALALAEHDQIDFLHVCREYQAETQDFRKKEMRIMRADAVSNRLVGTREALAAHRARTETNHEG